jgi:hypothetical protein
MEKERLIVSASGGRTSMMMAIWADEVLSDTYDIKYLFCNTGQEHEETLKFVKRVSEAWELDITWLEAVTHKGRKGCTYKEVTFETASRNGEPFEAMIKKYGIPNKGYPHCNRELKLNPMFDWRRKNFVGAKFAVGIRLDEMDRMSTKAEEYGVIYPFISMRPTYKQDVLDWWMDYPELDLRIPEHHGNCKWCWKKSDRKIKTIALDNPEFLCFPDQMEQKYTNVRPERGEQVFFRAKRSAREMAGEAVLTTFDKFTDPHEYDRDLDAANGCSESCEAFAS